MDKSESLGWRLSPPPSVPPASPHLHPCWHCGFGLIAQPLGHLVQCKPGAHRGHPWAAPTTALRVLLSLARPVTATCKPQLQRRPLPLRGLQAKACPRTCLTSLSLLFHILDFLFGHPEEASPSWPGSLLSFPVPPFLPSHCAQVYYDRKSYIWCQNLIRYVRSF